MGWARHERRDSGTWLGFWSSGRNYICVLGWRALINQFITVLLRKVHAGRIIVQSSHRMIVSPALPGSRYCISSRSPIGSRARGYLRLLEHG